ncbi:oxidation resistance protein 1, partial [Lunasporangiospora selenospora]
GSLSPPPSRRMELHQAMSDRMSLHPVPRSPSPFSSSPRQPIPQFGARQTPQQLRDRSVSPMSSPTLRPATSSSSTSGTPLLGPVGGMGSGPGSGTGGTKSNAGSRRKKRQKVVQYWKWTGMNDYMVLSEPGFIGLGGGKGKFGLWIHSDLERGHSSRCETFDNEPLALACHHPIRAGVPAAVSVTEPSPSSGSDSRSSSPKSMTDKEEFYCQTIEIWSMIL